MLTALLTFAVLAAPQGATSKPTSRPSRPMTDRERMVEVEWPPDAPGEQVARMRGKSFKWLPMVGASYGSPEEVADTVDDKDLVIGLEVEDRAFAFPIKMLGGPQREIVNEEYAGVPFAVNW